jgi:protein SCO1/2
MRRAILIAAVALAGCGGSKPAELVGQAVDPPVRAPGFSLVDESGRPVSVGSQRGHWLVVTFLYTHCPDVCPLIAAQLNRAIGTKVGREAGLRVISVSVDPARDTPTAVRQYAAAHRLASRFHWALGSRAALARVWRAYHVAALPGPRGTITHSTISFLIDPEGNERAVYDATVKADDVTGDLAQLT